MRSVFQLRPAYRFLLIMITIVLSGSWYQPATIPQHIVAARSVVQHTPVGLSSYPVPTEHLGQELLPPTATVPSASPIPEHPRLFFNASDLPLLREKVATTHAEIWQPVVDYVDTELGTSPLSEAPPDGGLATYRNAGNMLIPLAFVCRIYDQDDYCSLAKSYLLAYADWERWGEEGHRDLGHAHMVMGNAIAYDWLYPILAPEERETATATLALWAGRLYEASSESYVDEWNNWWDKAYAQNHYWTNHSALGMAGLALLGEDERAQGWVDYAAERMERVEYLLNGIGDGTWHESLSYQEYGLTMTLPFLVNLRRVQGTDIVPHDYLRNYPAWRIYNYIPRSKQSIMAYGDFEWSWANGSQLMNILRFVAREYQDGHAEWIAQKFSEHPGRFTSVWHAPWYVLELLYYDPSVQPLPPDDWSGSRVFPDLEGVIWRTGWGEQDMIFGLKSGPHGGRFLFDTFVEQAYPWDAPCIITGCGINIGHDHNDTNSFYLYRAGAWLAPEYEGNNKYQIAFHNTILIDEQEQYRPPDLHVSYDPEEMRGSDGFLEATASTHSFDYVASDATGRYKNIEDITDVTRHVVFLRPNYFVMLDNLAAELPHQYDWQTYVGESAVVEGRWIRANASSGGNVLGIGIATEQEVEATVARKDDERPYVRIRPAVPVEDVRLLHVLYPTDAASWDAKPTLTLLDDTGQAIALNVQSTQENVGSDDVVLTYDTPGAMVTAGDYRYDGRVAVVRRAPDDEIASFFIYGGTQLSDPIQGVDLVSNLDAGEPFEATYNGKMVAVYGTIRTEVSLYAPRAEQLTINGKAQPFTRSGDYIVFTDPGAGGSPDTISRRIWVIIRLIRNLMDALQP
jgi:hypothetical protein